MAVTMRGVLPRSEALVEAIPPAPLPAESGEQVVVPQRASQRHKAQPKPSSNQEWARVLVPGHSGDKKMALPSEIRECMFNRINRSSGETHWEARFVGEGLRLAVDLSKLDKKLRNKTRSQVYRGPCQEHDAFRTVLLWLWRKWVMYNPTGGSVKFTDLPQHVQDCLPTSCCRRRAPTVP